MCMYPIWDGIAGESARVEVQEREKESAEGVFLFIID